jgi:splicing factor 3A subunit 1
VIKHTASFVAMNGKKFLVSLTEKEKQNPQFEFLKPTHDLFQFFLKLVDAYKLCLQPKRDDIERYMNYTQDKNNVHARCIERYEYENQL